MPPTAFSITLALRRILVLPLVLPPFAFVLPSPFLGSSPSPPHLLVSDLLAKTLIESQKQSPCHTLGDYGRITTPRADTASPKIRSSRAREGLASDVFVPDVEFDISRWHSGTTWGATLIVPQAMEWGVSVDYSAKGAMAIPLIEAFWTSSCLVVAAAHNDFHGPCRSGDKFIELFVDAEPQPAGIFDHYVLEQNSCRLYLQVPASFDRHCDHVEFLLANRSITAYALEKYPDQSTVVSAIINAWRTASGFSVGYFQPAWIARNGIAAVFGTQIAVVVAVLVLTITPVIVFGKRQVRKE
ncbi:putative MFS transporter [Aspergillus affinis]|uniref:putative MFS transporter n=1 Tax=Aspergillus affinis TaxID=1070780 RepID=UPI0022FE9ED4|nr:uncharacterized protein KD926_011253 [Aspergillus affinis]KAI9038119.1 hypothetical protein KD926_011253 [Aspergillus affinis]